MRAAIAEKISRSIEQHCTGGIGGLRVTVSIGVATDGYGNAAVHHFTPDGKLIKTWGGPGGTPGYSVNNGTAHSRGDRQQRARGAFFPAYLGKSLRRIELTFDAPPAGTYTYLSTFQEQYAGGMKGTLTIK